MGTMPLQLHARAYDYHLSMLQWSYNSISAMLLDGTVQTMPLRVAPHLIQCQLHSLIFSSVTIFPISSTPLSVNVQYLYISEKIMR